MKINQRVRIENGNKAKYDGCTGTVDAVRKGLDGKEFVSVWMPPQPTNEGRSIRNGTSWLFDASELVAI